MWGWLRRMMMLPKSRNSLRDILGDEALEDLKARLKALLMRELVRVLDMQEEKLLQLVSRLVDDAFRKLDKGGSK